MEKAIESKDLAYKKKLVFSITCTAALLVIFLIYAYYTQEYVGGSDFYGYYAQSLLLKQGRVDMPVRISPSQYPSIAPLSYFSKDGRVLPQYPPGYPLLMALAGYIGLEFYVTPILGILSVILIFLLIKDLTDKKIALFFSLIWALFPIVVYGSTSVMSDLVAAFFILLSLYLYRKEKIFLSALALGFSLVVRPTNVLFCLVFLPVLIRDKQWFKFGCYFAIPASLYGIYNWLVYGAPWKIGYANVSERFITSVFFNHLLYYARETLIQFTPFLLILVFFAIGKKSKDRWFYVSWFLIFFIFYCFWRPRGDIWWWTRFLLPGFPALFFLGAMGLKNTLEFIKKRWKPSESLVYISLIIVALLIIAYYVNYGFTHPDIWEKNKGKHYYNISKMIANEVPDNSLVGSIEFSGCLRLYTGIETFNSFHRNSFFLIADMLKKQVPVYIAAEPWNLKRPMIKGILRIFRVKKILKITGWQNFFLYKIESLRKRAWKGMLRRQAAEEKEKSTF